jgi:hypothetical protein
VYFSEYECIWRWCFLDSWCCYCWKPYKKLKSKKNKFHIYMPHQSLLYSHLPCWHSRGNCRKSLGCKGESKKIIITRIMQNSSTLQGGKNILTLFQSVWPNWQSSCIGYILCVGLYSCKVGEFCFNL